MHRMICVVYGARCVWKTMVVKLFSIFQMGMQQTMEMLRLEQANIIVNPENTIWVKNVVHKGRHSFSAKQPSMSFSTVHATIQDIEFFNSSRCVMGYDFTILYVWDSQWASNKRHTTLTNHIQTTSICHYSSVTAFCDNEGPLILDFTSCKNAKHYCQILWKLSTMIMIKYPDKLMEAIILLHDIANSHAGHIVHNQQNTM